MVVIGHIFFPTNPRPVKTTALLNYHLTVSLSHTCTNNKPALYALLFHTHWNLSYGRQMACKHLRDTLRTYRCRQFNTYMVSRYLTVSLTQTCCACTCNIQYIDTRCSNLPLWKVAVYTKLSCCVAFEGVWLTCNFRCVRLTPCVSCVWSCITNIWMYSREGGGISNYKGYI